MLNALTNVRFWGKRNDAIGPLCRLMTQSRHELSRSGLPPIIPSESFGIKDHAVGFLKA
jgi:hypothetical protein